MHVRIPTHYGFPLAVALLTAGLALAAGIAKETPKGTIKGKTTAQESGNAVSAWVSITSTFQCDGRTLRFSTQSDNDGTFSFSRVPAGVYLLAARGRAHYIDPVKVTVTEARTVEIEAELEPESPSLKFYVHQHMFTPDERARVTCEGFVTTTDSVTFSVYRVDHSRLLDEYGGSIRDLIGWSRGDYPSLHEDATFSKPVFSLVSKFDSRITTRDSEGIFTERFALPQLSPGIYVVRAQADTSEDIDWLLVSRIGLVTKSVGQEVLAYAVNLKSGTPVAGAEIQVFSDEQLVGTGVSGPDGVARLKLAGAEGSRKVVARKGDSFAFVDSWAERSFSTRDVIYCYTDRPVYRPGQKVYFRGIARRFENQRYTPQIGKLVRVEVRDSRDNLVYRDTMRTDGFGSYYGHLSLNSESATGYYRIVSTIQGAGLGAESGFRVMAYRKPEFSVKVSFDKRRYLREDTVRAKISARYYFGAPVANALVNYSVNRSPFWLFEEDEELYSELADYEGFGESVKYGEVRTDQNGEAVVEFRATWPKPSREDPYDTDQLFTLDCYVTDRSDQQADGEGSVLAARGEFAVSVAPDKFTAETGSTVTADVTVRYHNHKPARDRKVEVVVARHIWLPCDEHHLRVICRKTLTTNSLGRARMSFKAREGDLEITATAVDRKGNEVSGRSFVWCWSGAGEIAGARYTDLQIVLDKKSYVAGETANLLINTAERGATALVTIESDRVHLARVVPLTSKSTSLEMPIKAAYKPNFYVAVCFVKDKEFFRKETRAKVSLEADTLRIRVEPNKPKYKPGDNAVYRIKATDSVGKPAVAQLSVGVVDEAIYAIAEDETIPIVDYFYERKPNSVTTGFSFPEIYLSDPDKAGSPRMNAEPRMRKRFEDTAFWSPNVVTNANGEAEVRFVIPDNLTTWRATIRGITANTTCGQAVNRVQVQQPLLVRLETPRFLVQHDSTRVTAAVHNYTGSGQTVRVVLKAPGLKLHDAPLNVVRVPDGGVERVDWVLSAPKPGEFSVSVTARTQTVGDAMQISLPVYPHGEERRRLKVGAITSDAAATETVILRSDSIPEATRLLIRLAPSLASSALGSLDYLARYPYGCTEQTTSAFLPDVLIYRSFRDKGIMDSKLERQLPEMVTKGLYRLYRFQLEDGGWAWCEYGQADVWMTAYVCYALVLARDAGFPVNSDALERGMTALEKLLRKSKPNLDTDFGCYVLSVAGIDTSEYFLASLVQNRLTARGLAYAALALSQNGYTEQAGLALSRMLARANRQPGLTYWTDADRRGWEGDNVETTAIALQALLRIAPRDPRVVEAIRWLMSHRTGGYWFSTRQTAQVLIAIAEYIELTGELKPEYDASVKINGKTVASLEFGRASVFDVEKSISIPPALLRKGHNSIQVAKSGTGNLYYAVELTQFVAKERMPIRVSGSGLMVARTYHKTDRHIRDYEREEPGPEVCRARTGEVLLVRLIMDASRPMRYVMLEDYIPAGCEIVDRGKVDYYEWDYWYSDRDVRDNKIAFFIDTLPAGRRVIEYKIRAGFAGKYHAPPAQLFGMYQPDTRACTAEKEFTVR